MASSFDDKGDVVAIQVVPVMEHADASGGITVQLEGPDEDTTAWGVYKRRRDGTVSWFADTGNEDEAMFVGGTLAQLYEVGVEPQLWRK